MSDGVLYDLPTEFFTEFMNISGRCDAQSIIPVEGRYKCHCSCGSWDIEADTAESGLALAREHTRITDAISARARSTESSGASSLESDGVAVDEV